MPININSVRLPGKPWKKKFCYEFCPLNEIKNTQCILEILKKYRKSERLGICVKYFLSFPQTTLLP